MTDSYQAETQPRCCGCIQIKTGMYAIGVFSIFEILMALNNVVTMSSYGTIVTILELIFVWGSKFIMAIFWIKWLRNDTEEERNLLQKANKVNWVYQILNTVVFLIYKWFADVAKIEGTKYETKELKAAALSANSSGFVGILIVSSLSCSLMFYFYWIVTKYQKFMVD